MGNNCGNCAFWKTTTFYESVPNDGECSRISEKVTVDVRYGWDGGYITAYETEEDFCCSLHESDTERKER